MSFSWNENEEKREYEIKGTVTIGTDEYRDLIKSNCDLRQAGQKEHDDWYREYCRAKDLEKKLQSCEEALKEINEWFDSDDSLRPNFRLWKVAKLEKQEEE